MEPFVDLGMAKAFARVIAKNRPVSVLISIDWGIAKRSLRGAVVEGNWHPANKV